MKRNLITMLFSAALLIIMGSFNITPRSNYSTCKGENPCKDQRDEFIP
jgi:hypothetical protein